MRRGVELIWLSAVPRYCVGLAHRRDAEEAHGRSDGSTRAQIRSAAAGGGRGEGVPRSAAQLHGLNLFFGCSIAQLINEVTMAHAIMALYTPAVTSLPGEGLPRTLARFASGASISLRRVAALSRLREGGSRFCNTETGALIQNCCGSGYSSIRHPSDPYQTPIRLPSDSHQTPIFNDKNDDEGFTGDSWNMTL